MRVSRNEKIKSRSNFAHRFDHLVAVGLVLVDPLAHPHVHDMVACTNDFHRGDLRPPGLTCF
jgi:hypothetical protein